MLGLAAIASSIARPPERDDRGADQKDRRSSDARAGGDTASSAVPRPGASPARPTTVRFRARAKPQTRALEQGRPATLLVEVDAPGQVDIPGLGLTQPAEPLTPARFDVLVGAGGRYRIVLRPAASDATSSTLGTLKVVPARERLGAPARADRDRRGQRGRSATQPPGDAASRREAGR